MSPISCLYVHPAAQLAQGRHECFIIATGKSIHNHCHYPPAPITAAIIVTVEATSHASTMDMLHFKSKLCIKLNNSSQIAWITMKRHFKTKMILIKIIKTKTMNMWVKATKSINEIKYEEGSESETDDNTNVSAFPDDLTKTQEPQVLTH